MAKIVRVAAAAICLTFIPIGILIIGEIHMSYKIDDKWKCMECDADLDAEECGEVRAMLKRGNGQVDMKCEECGENLTADTTDCKEGEVSINSEWVYS